MTRRAVAALAVGLAVLTAAACSPDDGTASSPDGGSAVDGSDVRIVTDGVVSPPRRVAPPRGDPIERVDRDAGISARLPDGSTVWFFGDTAERNDDESLRYFQVGSAAWSPPGDPTTTLGGVSDDGQVVPFAVPTEAFPACPREAPTAGMWPLAAVVDPREPTRVVLWMSNICLGPGRTAVGKGVSVGEWRYDPEDPPADRPIVVTVLEQNLFDGPDFGEAAFVEGERVVVYACEPAADSAPTHTDGTCNVGRVPLAGVADASAYELWTGDGWERGGTPAPIELGGPAVPPGPFSVAPDAEGVGYLMLYSPWPAFVPFVEVRASLSPHGPWSAATRLVLPDCEDEYQESPASCYAANLQPDMSSPGRVAFGFYDQLVESPPQLGSYVLTSVDLRLEPE